MAASTTEGGWVELRVQMASAIPGAAGVRWPNGMGRVSARVQLRTTERTAPGGAKAKRTLCAIRSRAAVSSTVAIAADRAFADNADLVLLSVVEVPRTWFPEFTLVHRLADRRATAHGLLVEAMTAVRADVRVSALLAVGDPSTVILEELRGRRYASVVIGGRPVRSRAFARRRVAAAVANATDTPLVVIPHGLAQI